MSQRVFALIDCNNFYASCERVFNPHLEGKPVVVLSNNDGCIIARSEEAKKIGISMGIPVFEIKELIENNDVNVFSTNYTLYGDMSQRIMTILSMFSPDIEVYSIDEAFIEISGIKGIDYLKYGQEIRETIKKWTGLPVSIGIAPTKTLAKIANHIVKLQNISNDVLVLANNITINEFLKKVDVNEIWGVGERYNEFLVSNGIATAFDLKNANENWIRSHMHVVGQRIVNELRGESCLALDQVIQEKKDICTSRSYGQALTDYDDIIQATTSFAVSCAEKLRKQKSCARAVTVFLMTNKYANGPRYVNYSVNELSEASNDTSQIIPIAAKGLKQIFKKGYKYKKSGVIVSDLVPENQIQLNLWDHKENGSNKDLMNVIDQINSKLGKDKVTYAIQGIEKRWNMRQERLSPKYTTKWDEILTINLNKK
ncbi:Y-family DNA polymerase [candidate division KSB1 bacterium]